MKSEVPEAGVGVGKYLYGIVDARQTLPSHLSGLGGGPISRIRHRGLAALVSDSPIHPWPINEETVVAHEAVVEGAMDSGTVLPVRFNTILRGESEIVDVLEARYESFRTALDRLQGKVEMGVKVLWEPRGGVGERGDHRVRFFNDGPTSEGPGRSYLLRRLEEHRQDEAFRKQGEVLIEKIQRVLAPLAVERCLRKFPTPRLLFDAAYLLAWEGEETLRGRIRELEEEMGELRFLLTGPWPPHSFVNLRIGPGGASG